jgi:hypothetical protein
VEAHVEGGISDLSVARSFTHALDSIGGQVKLGLDLAGTIEHPEPTAPFSCESFGRGCPGTAESPAAWMRRCMPSLRRAAD